MLSASADGGRFDRAISLSFHTRKARFGRESIYAFRKNTIHGTDKSVPHQLGRYIIYNVCGWLAPPRTVRTEVRPYPCSGYERNQYAIYRRSSRLCATFAFRLSNGGMDKPALCCTASDWTHIARKSLLFFHAWRLALGAKRVDCPQGNDICTYSNSQCRKSQCVLPLFTYIFLVCFPCFFAIFTNRKILWIGKGFLHPIVNKGKN